MYIMIRSIAGRSALTPSAPAHVVGLSTAPVLYTLTVELISSFGQSQKLGIHDFNCVVTEFALYRGVL